MEIGTDSQTIGGAILGAVTALTGWIFKTLFTAQKEQDRKLTALEVRLAGDYVPRPEIEARMDRLQESVEKRIDRLQESVDKVLDHLNRREH